MAGLTRSWCAIWFVLSRHGGVDVVGPFDSFLIVAHSLLYIYIYVCITIYSSIVIIHFQNIIMQLKLSFHRFIPWIS